MRRLSGVKPPRADRMAVIGKVEVAVLTTLVGPVGKCNFV
jgi:hypothetical protein